MRGLVSSLLLIVCAGCASAPAGTSTPAPPIVVMITDGQTLRVEVDPTRGGAIVSGHILDNGEISPELVDLTSQTGRGWQADWTDGTCTALTDAQLCAGAAECLNPTLAGDACGRFSGGMLRNPSPKSLAVESLPLDFGGTSRRPLDVVTTLAIIAPGVMRVDYTVTNMSPSPFGFDAWQGLPILFLPPVFSVSTLGGVPVTDRVETVSGDWHAGPSWVSSSTSDGWTVLLDVPAPHPWSIGFPGPISPGAGWLQAYQWQALEPGETGSATAWIVVGRSLAQAKARAEAIG